MEINNNNSTETKTTTHQHLNSITSEIEAEKILFFNKVKLCLNSSKWHQNLIDNANDQCGFSPNYHRILFPDAIKQIILEFSYFNDQSMISYLQENHRDEKSIRAKIASALDFRIIQTYPKSKSQKELFNHIGYTALYPDIAFKCALKTCDEIWRCAGDKSTDWNYYSKRSILLSIYLRAILIYIADESDESAITKTFIRDSLDNTVKFGKLKKTIKLPKISEMPIIRLFA
ncbi:MAG: COQ9 family protein [Rickettsiaceae bacterium]